jgi:acetoin reductase-like protein
MTMASPSSHHVRAITTSPKLQAQTRNRVAIVTGAARGIGRAIALRLAQDGYSITASDLPALQSQLDSLVSEIQTSSRGGEGGVRAHAHTADVTSPAEVEALVRSSVSELGRLDTMVANAGIAQVKPLLELTPEDVQRMLTVNVAGVHYCFQAAAKQMISQGEGGDQEVRGKLIAAASIVAFKPFALMGHYSASKWAVRGLSQVYAMELAKHKITANAYAPGIVDTKMWELIDEGLGRREGKEKGEMIRKYSDDLIALGRTSVPEDVAGLVSFLASKDADYITGQTYVVDGGIIYT